RRRRRRAPTCRPPAHPWKARPDPAPRLSRFARARPEALRPTGRSAVTYAWAEAYHRRRSASCFGSAVRMQTWPGEPFPLGATFDGRGTNFSVFSEVATRVE